MYDIKRAITVSNHTTVLDPVKIAGLVWPRGIFQTLLEATVEAPFVGTITRLLGGVPVSKDLIGFKRILEICKKKSFNYRRYLHFYPEGECFIYNQNIREFNTGAFLLAAELDIPIIPLVTVFSDGILKPKSFLGRSLPVETLVVLEPVYPSLYIKRNSSGRISVESVKQFTEAVRQKMQDEINKRNGSNAFYRGRMERIKGLND